MCGITAHENLCSPVTYGSAFHRSRKKTRTLILLGIGGGSCTKQRDAENVALASKSILAFGQNGDAVAVLAQIGVLNDQGFAVRADKTSQDDKNALCVHKLQTVDGEEVISVTNLTDEMDKPSRYPTWYFYALGAERIQIVFRISHCRCECSKEARLGRIVQSMTAVDEI